MRGRPGRWVVVAAAALLLTAAAPDAAAHPPRDLGRLLVDYYGTPAGYRRERRDVLRWHRTTRNGCAAFASTALRHIGVEVPRDRAIDGWGISRITFALSAYLEKELHWGRVLDAGELRPGDLVFTTGYPDHVFVFQRWADRSRRIARALDNRSFAGARPLFPAAGSDVSAFAYALRPAR
ncbi:MAG TPA: hypothetical protein VMZ28_09925 [Kofleriaceae bacterium]|nr:hypothetical protein [Kofleriaceae bacterium]